MKVGIDVVGIERIALAVRRSGRGFLKKAYTEAELAYCAGSAERLAGRAAADQLRVGNQPTQPTASLHSGDSTSGLAHHERTSVAKSEPILFRPRLPRKP